MNKRLVYLVTLVITFVVLSSCGNTPPVPYHFQVLGHRAVLSADFIGNNDEEITLSIDGCLSVFPAFVKTPIFGTASFQIHDVSCPEGISTVYSTVVGDVDSSGNFTNVKVTIP